ncbi:BTAD domain-containing putative transcriptional regulator [Pseudonocardia alaniniphila]|uniref:AfsR/SARP family transcriptional regulator n=1 Tax=Pseudonocardia alaniniphila TaxID=75291 RepID=A0ABS9TUU2_9PSEU|nr:BTAD domain-containing putative transcriptional regulator [Pseudonocardia alaniniphila]MCH6172334.1 AfsR/SARP family transcriptional regulator [Pseudonocardia alaniniphila]
MRITLLGAVEVWPAGSEQHPVSLGGLRLRGLLARLALDAGRPVAVSELVDDLWGDAPPEGAVNALQALVLRLRRAIGADLVDTAARGYQLRVEPEAVDALRFASLLTAADAADDTTAHALLGHALALWHGAALTDVLDLPFAGPVAHRLGERRALAVERRARLGLELGQPAVELDALRAQLDAAPLRESTAVLLARGLHATGRQADALAVLDSTRTRLADELGVDPGAELEAARLAVLRGDATPARVTAPAPAFSAHPPAAPLTSFVGRTVDVERIRALLGTARLVTLTGPGGAGKTRLAREAVRADGAETLVAELAALTAPEQLPAAVLAAVGGPELLLRIQDDTGPPTTARLVTALGGRELILVLDNCEHLVDGVAVLAETLLGACPLLRVLATSREPLGVPGEVLHPVEALAPVDAVQLFVDRATAVRPGFGLGPDVESAVTEICRRLDGQPLPIELAAARLRSLTPTEIAARLDDRFRLLTSGARTALPRHQTLRAVVDWSWDLLDEPERAVARRLAAFAGGATVAAAERVCAGPAGPAPGEVFELLAALVDKSLVVAIPQNGSTRYRMLETIREYAGERLDESGERAVTEAAHAALVLELAEAAEPHLRRAEQLTWLARLRAEADEIDVALRRAVAAGDAGTAHRLVAAMAWAWIVRGLFDEAVRWVEAVQPLTGPAPVLARAMNTAYLALVGVARGDLPAAERAVEAALALADGLPRPLPPVLELLGPVYALFAGSDPGPITQLCATDADPWVRAFALQTQAQIAENEGRLDDQRRYLRAAHELFAGTGDRFGLGIVVHALGELEDIAGEHDAAARAYDEAIALAGDLGNDDDLPQFMTKRAMLAARRGDVATAREMLQRASTMARGLFSTAGLLSIALAQVERLAGDVDAARVHVARAATELRERGSGAPQRAAYLAMTRAAVELTAGDRQAARAALAEAVTAAVESRDGPIAAAVAEVAVLVALAEGDAECAGLLLGIAAAQRGAIDRGNPEVLAALDRVRDALGSAAAQDAVRRGRELPRDEGLAVLAEKSTQPI